MFNDPATTKFSDYKDAYRTIRLERGDDGIVLMTLHHEGGSYQWGPQGEGRAHTHTELAQAVGNLGRDPDNKVVILTGTGDVFSGPPASTGHILPGGPKEWEYRRFYSAQIISGLLSLPITISCINGPAYRHAEIPMLGDIVLAADDALVQDSAHFPSGVVPGDGINLVFPYLMGWTRGRYFHLTGQKLTAAEMKDLGLVNEVLPRAQLLPRAWALARQFAQLSPLTLRYTKQVFAEPLKAFVAQYAGHAVALEALAAIDVYTAHTSAEKKG